MKRAAAALLAMVAGCSSRPTFFPVPSGILTVTAYVVTPTLTTPEGVRVDPSGQELPPAYLAKVDRITDEAFACLGLAHKPITLKVASDWFLNCDKTQQVLPPVAGACDPNKDGDCQKPCAGAHWRAFVQRDGAIVSTPSLYLYKDPLVRLLTGVQSIWTDPKLEPCATPTSTGPLDGIGP